MTDTHPPTGVPTLDELYAIAASADQRLYEMNRDLRAQQHTGTDDGRLVRVAVDSAGQVTGATINPATFETAARDQLRDAFVAAATRAQQTAREFTAERTRYYFGEWESTT